MNTNDTLSRLPATVSRCGRPSLLFSALLTLGVAASVHAGTQPHIISFDVPGAADTGCFSNCAVSINNLGEVTGSYLDANNVFHGFVREPDGKIVKFEAPGADTGSGDYNGTLPNSINDAGWITGIYLDTGGVSHGFLRSPENVFTKIDIPGYSATTPISLNLEGAVVGFANDANSVFRGFLRHPDGKFETWIGPGGCNTNSTTGCYGTAAFSINFLGTIAGGYEDDSGNFVNHGLVRTAGGKLTSFDVPGAGTGGYQGTGCPGCSTGLNQLGAMASYYIDANYVAHGFLRSPSGGITTFDSPGNGSQGFGCFSDCAIGLNDLGAITGSYLDANNVYHGFIRSPDGTFRTFQAPGADTTPGDYNGTFPVSINDFGVVAGYYIDANNVYHGFLLLP